MSEIQPKSEMPNATDEAVMKMTVLGSGTSSGVPLLNCSCSVCQSSDPKNKRCRCSLYWQWPGMNLLIDTPADLRTQALAFQVRQVDAVFYTHLHADHLHGIDDLRPFSFKKPVHVYLKSTLYEEIRERFPYLFKLSSSFIPQLQFHSIDEKNQFDLAGKTAQVIPLDHGGEATYGLRIDQVAYLTDVKVIPQKSLALLKNLRYLIIDAHTMKEGHPKHMSFSEALQVIKQIQPQQTFFTHLTHEVDYTAACATLPEQVSLAYDGLILTTPA